MAFGFAVQGFGFSVPGLDFRISHILQRLFVQRQQRYRRRDGLVGVSWVKGFAGFGGGGRGEGRLGSGEKGRGNDGKWLRFEGLSWDSDRATVRCRQKDDQDA